MAVSLQARHITVRRRAAAKRTYRKPPHDERLPLWVALPLWIGFSAATWFLIDRAAAFIGQAVS